MEENRKPTLAEVGIAFIAVVPLLIWQSWVAMEIYNMFVAKVPGAPPLTLFHMFGIRVIASLLLTGGSISKGETTAADMWRSLSMGVLHPAITLGSAHVGLWLLSK